jgi:nitronate monooxygenase
LLLTKEAPIHENLKKALMQAGELDTTLVMRSIGSTHRVWINPAAQKCLELETRGAELAEVLEVVSGERAKVMFDQGDLSAGLISCGQGVGLAHDIPTVQELFDRIIEEASTIAKKLAA